MRKFLFCIIFLFITLGFAAAFSEQDIISPVSGTWNNMQPLVLNVENGTEIYYSFTEIDPLRFGFAYDGPVVLDRKGDVSLRITAVDANGERKDFTVEYSVKDNNFAGNEKSTAFINDIIAHPIKRYVSGSVFSIPESFNYSIDTNDDSVFTGSDLHISEKNNVERYVPFTMTDGSTYLHFVLKIIPQQKSSLHSRTIPFSIENWNIISFNSKKYVYSIDDGMWTDQLTACVLDRLTVHTIRWKKASGEEDAEIFSYKLPPMPQLVSSVEPYGQVTFSLMPAPNDIDNGISYKMGRVPQNLSMIEISDGLYDSITIDAFYGEELSSEFYAGVYYDGVYQGPLKHSVIVDRMPPKPPVMSSYSQGQTVIVADAEDGADVYYSISEPLEFDAEDIILMESRFADLRTGEYQFFNNGRVKLSSVSDKATFYKLQAYSVDMAGNKSDIIEYRIIVDEHNFYLNPLAINSDKRDGTYVNPFATLEEAVLAMNEMSQMRLHVMGNVTVGENVLLTSDCDIIGKNSSIMFVDNASFYVKNASVSIKDCSLVKNTSSSGDMDFISVSDGALLFDNCQISAVFASDGNLIESFRAAVKFDNTSLTIHASSYGCNVKSENSSFISTNSRAVAVAHTCVNFSFYESSCAMSGTETDISAHIGRTMECIKSSLVLDNNIFRASFDAKLKHQIMEALWKDADTTERSYNNSILYGF